MNENLLTWGSHLEQNRFFENKRKISIIKIFGRVLPTLQVVGRDFVKKGFFMNILPGILWTFI